MEELLTIEKNLYSNLSLVKKYNLLENLRLKLDWLYKNDIDTYEQYKQKLNANTWNALEDAWTLWNPTPKNSGKWGGENEMTFYFLLS